MWVMGNEIDISNPSRLAMKNRINNKMDFARNYTMTKWGRRVPVTTCVVDLPETYDQLAKDMRVDVFCANAGYRSDSLTDLFPGNPNRSMHNQFFANMLVLNTAVQSSLVGKSCATTLGSLC